MTSRTLALITVVIALSAAACGGGGDGGPGAAEDSGAAESSAAAGASASSASSAAAVPGSLVLGGERTICVDLQVSDLRDLTYGRSIEEVVSSVELRSVSLVGARQVQAVEAWVIQTDGVDLVETWSGWPLPQDERARLGWDSRVPLKGARLEPGERYDLLVRTLRGTGRGAHGFDAIEVVYEADGDEHVVRDGTSLEFRRGC